MNASSAVCLKEKKTPVNIAVLPAECKDIQHFSVQTPMGIIRAVESKDKDNPGIVILFTDSDGNEHKSCAVQFMKEQQDVKASVYSPYNQDKDPVFTHWIG